MRDRIAQLKHEIEECERQIAARPFGALLDKKRSDLLYHRLKKKRKELARAEGTATGASDTPEAKAAPAPKPKPKTKAKPSAKKAAGRKANAKSPGARSTKTTKRPQTAAGARKKT